MKKVIKVSIGNMAFTLEEDAHLIIKDYLDSLNSHYEGNMNGGEIVDGIEERMSELLQERCPEGTIVTAPVAKEVIDILGRPEVIDEESGEKEQYNTRYAGRKKFYRDPVNKIFGGVCSGMGIYFDRDASLFRIIFILATLLFSIPSWGIGGGIFIILYLLLWLIFPAARTVQQRCEMRGETPTVDSIEKSISKGAKKVENGIKQVQDNNPNFWHMVGRVISIFIGSIFTIVGLSGVVACAVVFFGFEIWGMSIPFIAIESWFGVMNSNAVLTVFMKIFIALLIFLPFLGLLYAGIQMMFDFKSPKWRPGLVIFVLWVISILGCAVMGISISSDYWRAESREVKTDIILQSDTLYVEFVDVDKYADSKVWIDADRDEYNLVFFDGTDKDSEVIAYPFFYLRRGYEDASIKAKSHFFPEVLSFSELKNMGNLDFYSFDGKTLKLNPVCYDRDSQIKEVKREVRLYIGDNVVVIVKDPIYHEFNHDFEYSNIKWLNKFEKWD